jgi:hypothetical protein
MSNSYVTLWTQGYCKGFQRVDDRGPLSVMFGSPHTSLPSVAHLKPGDWVYPVTISAGSLFVIGRMRIAAIIPYEDYARDRGKLSVSGEGRWVVTAHGSRRIHPHPGHREPSGSCIDHVAIGESGTPLRFDNAIPGDTLATLRFGPKAGREQPLRGVAGGRLMHSLPLQGHYRRLSEESATLLERLIDDPA